jgi:putative intracellular protease/amidase
MKRLLFAVALALLPLSVAHAADTDAHFTPPKSGTIKVAFVLSEGATVIDFAGPWEVFQDVMLDGHGDDMDASMPFQLYTVAPSKAPIHTSGSMGSGLTITPDYSFADAPIPDVVVVGAQSGGPGLSEWLQKVHADNRVIMSVCTGAFKVAKAGLFDGMQATTHHAYFGNFASQFPQVKLMRSVRYVQGSPILFSAGGLSSGIDLALHIVAGYYGTAAAQKTADYMEYQGTGWKTNQGITYAVKPAGQEAWTGDISAGHTLQLHVTNMSDGSVSAVADVPASGFKGVPASVTVVGNKVSIDFAVPGHPATFTGMANSTGDAISGTYTQDGKSSSMTLAKQQTSM